MLPTLFSYTTYKVTPQTDTCYIICNNKEEITQKILTITKDKKAKF